MPASICPTCGEPAVDRARYCEACGAELAPPPSSSPHPCVGCGAAASAIGEDGYCGVCGMKQPAPSDHRELDLHEVAAVTDRGLHHHRNEDAFAIALLPLDGARGQIVVVCDGVSSIADSDRAAQAAADAACDALKRATSFDLDELRERTIEAVAAGQAAARAVPPKDGQSPSTTIVTAVAAPDGSGNITVVVGWLGDSRAYHLIDTTITPITVDDSWAAEQIAAGMPEPTAYADPLAHTITGWLGADSPDPIPHLIAVTLPSSARLMLCSDGLWNYAPTTAELAAVVNERLVPDNLELARALTNFARDAGGHDNITVALATV